MPWWIYCILGAVTVIVYDLLKKQLNKHIGSKYLLSFICFILTIAICSTLMAVVDGLFPELRAGN